MLHLAHLIKSTNHSQYQISEQEEILYYENFELEKIYTPVNADRLEKYLIESNYDKEETRFLISGFKNGFDLGYRGPEKIRQTANNLKFTIGNEIELWNKVMKEVKEKRYAGPFSSIPFDNYIQSPIGLVPKDGGQENQTHFPLIPSQEGGKGGINK